VLNRWRATGGGSSYFAHGWHGFQSAALNGAEATLYLSKQTSSVKSICKYFIS